MFFRQYPCCFFTPNKKRHRYDEPDPLFAPFHRCKTGSKNSIIHDLYKTPGISERMIKSLLLSDCPEKKCKCGDAWNGQDPLESIPFTRDLAEQPLVTEKDSQLQLLMQRLGFFEDDTSMSEQEKVREWLKEINKIYNEYNNNYISIKHRKSKRRCNSTYSYLDYPLYYSDSKNNYIYSNHKKDETQRNRADSLLSYGARLSVTNYEWRESKDLGELHARWRANNEFPIKLAEDLKEDIEKLTYRLRSFRAERDTKPSLNTFLYYPPYVAGHENVWKTLNPDFGAADLRDKLQLLGYQTDFSMWRMLALDCIIKGQPIPYHLYDSKLLRELRADLQELLEKIRIQNEEEIIRSKL